MRVLLKSRPRDESGAVAVLVGLLALFLIGISAFTADLGLAYINKRQVQTAADAAAMGAAGVYSNVAGANGCSTLLSNGRTAAAAEASAKVAANDNDSAPATHVFTPTCTNGALTVRVTASTSSQSFFGRLFGRNSYAVDRSATAAVAVASSVGAGMRPLALCSRDLLTLTTFPAPVMKFQGPGGGSSSPSDCPDTSNAGNWWVLRCPGESGNVADNIVNGCKNPVSLVPNQPAPGTTALTSHLLNYCTTGPAKPESCLGSEPGNLRDSGSLNGLKALIDSEKQIFLPAFCGAPACSPGAVTSDGGSNTIYPVFRLISVRLCGIHLGNGNGSHSKMTGICANNPSGFTVSAGGQQDNYLLVAVQQTNVSGGPTSTCMVGEPCDTGLRQVRMTE